MKRLKRRWRSTTIRAVHNRCPGRPGLDDAVNNFPYRYAQLRVWAVLALVLVVLSLLGGMIWRNSLRFETLRAYAVYAHRIQELARDIQGSLSDYSSAPDRGQMATRLSRLTTEISELANNDHHAAPETPLKLAEIRETILLLNENRARPDQQQALLQALRTTGEMLDAEATSRESLLDTIGLSTRTEVILVFATSATLLLFAGFFLRYRVLRPLNDLNALLLRLAREDYRPMDPERINPLLLPVFNSYNVMVNHLAELEEAKRDHAQSLEAEVRSATRALLEQQADLARSERLAAVGELAAGIAHELRNPLAGIQISCSNLRSEVGDADQVQRLSLVIDELKRMARLLSELLNLSKHTPAPLHEFDLSLMIRELVALVRYQLPPSIRLRFTGPASLTCKLPESQIRQNLLNLVLNSAQALGQDPGAILIEVREMPDLVHLNVIDDGPGFPPDLLKTGIRPFVTGKSGGTGLGLAMVQRFVRELGGQVTLENVTPRGACVRMKLPPGPVG